MRSKWRIGRGRAERRRSWCFGFQRKTYRRISDNDLKEHEARRGHRLEKEKARVDQSSRVLEPIKPGEAVLAQDPKTLRWSIEATVVSKRNRRSYNIEIDGRNHVRNRRFLKPITSKFQPEKADLALEGHSMNKKHNLRSSRTEHRVTFLK